MKKFLILLVLAIAFISCEKEVIKPDQPENQLKKKGIKLEIKQILATGDTIVISPSSPLEVHVGDSLLVVVTPSLPCSWHNSHPQSAELYVVSWGETPYNEFDDQCYIIGKRAVPYPMYGWGLITAGYTFPDGTRINTTNNYIVIP